MQLNIFINSLLLTLILMNLSPLARAESSSRLLTKQEVLQQLQQVQAYLHQGASAARQKSLSSSEHGKTGG
jgi:hypothetical protein